MDSHADLYEFEDEPSDVGYTTVQNLFIKYFMPAAKGNYVKVYLAGLMRCYGSKAEQWASYQTIAEEQQVSVDVVKRAWRYWENLGLIRRVPRYLRDPSRPDDFRTEPDTEYCYQTSNVIKFRRDLRPLVERMFSGVQNCPPSPGKTAPPRGAKLPPEEKQDEEQQQEERQDQTVSSGRIVSVFESHMGRPPSKTEQRTLERLAKEYGTWWVECAFTEYLCQSDKQQIKVPLRYIEGVLENWRVEGMRMTDVIEHLHKLKEGKR
ncbi:MAG: hypothetical protein GX161_04515 [Firmicutes bacterium]|nr:hypothetical protein [Bacillota bacterium]